MLGRLAGIVDTFEAMTSVRPYRQHTFSVAKQVRTDTSIGNSPVSVAFAAVSLAKQIFSGKNFSRHVERHIVPFGPNTAAGTH